MKPIKIKKKSKAFNTLVDAALWAEANKARAKLGKTWVELIEEMLLRPIIAQAKEQQKLWNRL